MTIDQISEKYANDVYSPILGKEFSGKGKDFDKALREKRYEGLYKQIDFYLKHYSKQHKLSDVQMKDLKRLVNEIRSYGKNGERWVTEVKKTVKEFKDEADNIEMIKAKYSKDAMVSKSELEKKKYTQFFVNGEDINGKVLRIPQRRFNKFEEAVRVAKSLQNANTRHVFVEGGWDNNQVEPKALYDWRNPKAR